MHTEIRKKVNMVLFVCLMLVCGSSLFSDYPTTITTPNGSVVPDTYIRDEMSSADIAYWNSYVDSAYPNADRIGSATNTYNCHAYAWYGTGVWIGYSTTTAEDIFWTDGSYVETTESLATKVSYSGNHSAVTTSTPGYYISKWGSLPLMFHYKTDCPAAYGSPAKFYKRAPVIPVDLYVSGDPVYPITVYPGGTFTALCSVEGYSPGSSTLKYYLSSNTTLDASDTYLGSDYVGAVSSSTPSTETENFVLPSWVTTGTWYIIFEADANNQVTEVNENNNTDYIAFSVVTPPSGPDLYIYSTSYTPSLVQPGYLVYIKCIVKNQGGTTASSSTLKYYLSSDSILSADDTYLTSRTISSLAPGAVSTEQSYGYSVPTNSPDRIYFIMVADANNQVSEENENNNTGVRSIFIVQ